MSKALRIFVFLSLVTLCFALPCAAQKDLCQGKEDPEKAFRVVESMYVTILLCGKALTDFNAQMSFFKQKYLSFFKVDWIINVTVTDKYQAVDSSDDQTQDTMANEFYVPGAITMLWTTFNPNPDNLLGFAFGPQGLDWENSPQDFYTMMDIPTALTPTGTTIVHEVGHMFGLHHTFIEFCDSCTENEASENRDIVGDLCNDTLAIPQSFTCDALDRYTTDCNGFTFTDLTDRPQNNFMAYTPDSCITTFTPQQAARGRCYVEQELWRFTESATDPVAPPISEAPSGAPAGSTPSGNNVPGKVPGGVVSAGSATQVVLSVVALALYAL